MFMLTTSIHLQRVAALAEEFVFPGQGLGAAEVPQARRNRRVLLHVQG